jgi:hypothetical protein
MLDDVATYLLVAPLIGPLALAALILIWLERDRKPRGTARRQTPLAQPLPRSH